MSMAEGPSWSGPLKLPCRTSSSTIAAGFSEDPSIGAQRGQKTLINNGALDCSSSSTPPTLTAPEAIAGLDDVGRGASRNNTRNKREEGSIWDPKMSVIGYSGEKFRQTL